MKHKRVNTRFLELDLFIQQYVYLLAKDKNIHASCGDKVGITDLNDAETIYFQDVNLNEVLFFFGRVIVDTDENKSYYTVFYNEDVSVVKTIDDFKFVIFEIQKYLLEQNHPIANTMLIYLY